MSAPYDSQPRIISVCGLTLRDYFAGQALVGILSDNGRTGGCTMAAEAAYRYADAMIAARTPPTEKQA